MLIFYLKLVLHAGMRYMISKRRPTNLIATGNEEKTLFNTVLSQLLYLNSDHQYPLLLSEIEEAGVVVQSKEKRNLFSITLGNNTIYF